MLRPVGHTVDPSPGAAGPRRDQFRCVPGIAVGAGGAVTGGVNLLPPVGSIDFSVGETEVVVGVVLEGLGFSPPPHPAVSAPIATSALPPTTNASRRRKRPDIIIAVLSPISADIRSMFAGQGENEPPVNIMTQVWQTVV
jgi:hypothetical protein